MLIHGCLDSVVKRFVWQGDEENCLKHFCLPSIVFNGWVIVFQIDPIRVLNANRWLAHTCASNKDNFYFIGANGLFLIGKQLEYYFFGILYRANGVWGTEGDLIRKHSGLEICYTMTLTYVAWKKESGRTNQMLNRRGGKLPFQVFSGFAWIHLRITGVAMTHVGIPRCSHILP